MSREGRGSIRISAVIVIGFRILNFQTPNFALRVALAVH